MNILGKKVSSKSPVTKDKPSASGFSIFFFFDHATYPPPKLSHNGFAQIQRPVLARIGGGGGLPNPVATPMVFIKAFGLGS